MTFWRKKRNRKLAGVFFSCFAIFLILAPMLALGQTGPIITCDDCQYGDLINAVQRLLNFLIYLASLIAVGLFVYAGIILVFSGGNTSKKDKAKEVLWNTIVGFIIVLTAFLIVKLVLATFGTKQTSLIGYFYELIHNIVV